MFVNLRAVPGLGAVRTAVAFLLVTVSLALAVPTDNTAPGISATAPVVEIGIDNFTFTPDQLTVAPGTTIKWTNHDDIPHVIAEGGQTFRSPALDTDDSYSITLTKAGTVDYYCTLHPHMVGHITVK